MKELTTNDINQILSSIPITRNTFVGTFPACTIPVTDKKFYTFVTNTKHHLHKLEILEVTWFLKNFLDL